MRELFIHYRLDLTEQQHLAAAQQIIAEHIAGRTPITARQVYRDLQRIHIVDSTTPYSRWRKLFVRGLYSGHIDWSVIPECRVEPIVVPTAADRCGHELWVRSFHSMDAWLRDACRARCHVRTTHGRTWYPHQLYYAGWGLAERLLRSDPVQLFYISDPVIDANVTMQRMLTVLIKMVQVRLARRSFNQEIGHELWQPQGLRCVVKGRGSNTRRKVKAHMVEALATISSLMQITRLDVSGNTHLADRSPLELRTILHPVLE